MKRCALIVASVLGLALPAYAACDPGVYRSAKGEILTLTPTTANGVSAIRYTFLDGRRGILGDAPEISCAGADVQIGHATWPKASFRETPTHFTSHGADLSGTLIEGSTGAPLVVMVHGSERTSPTNTVLPLMLAAQGLSVFIYDKRGTGSSAGEYTQNFDLLADDAAAALAEAKRLAAGRFSRIGFFGGSQGGWIAPLAATKGGADFVAIGFGLVLSPIDEDRQQVIGDLRAKGFGDKEIMASAAVTDATAALVRSHFVSGFDRFAQAKQRYRNEPWFAAIEGEFSGDLLRMTDADLKRIGRALHDNLELIWDYDAMPPLRTLSIPQLWVLAGADREAPPELPRQRLVELKAQGKPIDLYVFPDTDHGIVEFEQQPDGSRRITRFTDGYFRLLADWIRGDLKSDYGRAQRIR